MKMDRQHEISMTDLLKCNIEREKQDDATFLEHLKEEIIIYIV